MTDKLFSKLKRTCAHCGKVFILRCGAHAWQYKRRENKRLCYYCGWNCLREAERERERERKNDETDR